MKPDTTGICLDREQSNGEWSRFARSFVDGVGKRLGHSCGQAADHVLVVEPDDPGGGNDAEHPAPLHAEPTDGLELVTHNTGGVVVFGDQFRPGPPPGAADPVERREQHRIIRARTTRWVRRAFVVLQMAAQVEVGQHCGAQGQAEKLRVFDVESVPFGVIGKQ